MSSGARMYGTTQVHPVTLSLQGGGLCINSLLDCVSMLDAKRSVGNRCSWGDGTGKELGR